MPHTRKAEAGDRHLKAARMQGTSDVYSCIAAKLTALLTFDDLVKDWIILHHTPTPVSEGLSSHSIFRASAPSMFTPRV